MDELRGQGLVALVRVAEQLALSEGTFVAAAALAARLIAGGTKALPAARDDVSLAARNSLQESGCIDETGVNLPRIAELISVCEILAAATPLPPPAIKTPSVVLSAPEGAARVEDRESLSNLVMSTIRSSTQTLHLAGAFWNPAGFGLLNTWLLPAMSDRKVSVTYYLNEPDNATLKRQMDEQLSLCERAGDTNIFWYTGEEPTLQHVKFAIADRERGYLGTANLTSWGLDRGHIEAGVELFPAQAARLIEFFEELTNTGWFIPQ